MALSLRPLLVLRLAICSMSSAVRAGDGALPPARRWIPERAMVVLEVSQPKAVLDFVLGKKVTDLVTAIKGATQLSISRCCHSPAWLKCEYPK
jgi:hypothetical protein